MRKKDNGMWFFMTILGVILLVAASFSYFDWNDAKIAAAQGPTIVRSGDQEKPQSILPLKKRGNAEPLVGSNFAKMSEDTYVWRLRLTDKREIVSTFEEDMRTFDRECPNRQIIGWTIVERYCPMSTADICPPYPPEKPVKPIPSVVWIATKRK